MFAFLTPDGLCVAVDVLVIVTDSALLWRNVGWEFSGHSPGDVSNGFVFIRVCN